MTYWGKIFIFAFGVSLLSSSFPGFIVPQKAEALAAIVHDPISNATEIKNTAESTIIAATVGSSLSQQLLEWGQSFVVSTLKRRILDVMVDQVVTWVQGGGEPRFITDWETFLGDIGQGAVGEFVEQIGAGFLCAPFSLQVRIGLLPVNRFANNSPFTCTLDQIVQNVENFYEDFRNGGWIAYNATSELQNNYYGALLISWDARNSYVADKVAAAANSALANKGFLGTKKCYDTATGQEVSESDAAGQERVRERLVEGGTGSTRDYTTGGEVNGSFRSQQRTIRCEDTTPGGVISATVEKAVGSDFDFIVNAQQLGDYAAAIVNALVNRVIMEGVNGLRGVHSGSGGTYQPSGNSRTTYGGLQSVSSIPQSTRNAIANNASTSGGSISNLSRAELVTRLNNVLARRTALRPLLTEPSSIALSYARVVEDTLACHQTVPALRSGSIHDAILLKQSDAQGYLTFIQPVIENNTEAIDELTQTINQLNRLTDAQFTARINEFQVVFINSDPAIVSAELSKGSVAVQQIQTFVTPDVINDAQRDLDYCVSQGGTAPNRFAD
ncbi:MAG: hypothetical protein Q7R85_03810 [bacterium]|nr:hypothetical protein [bacterium]